MPGAGRRSDGAAPGQSSARRRPALYRPALYNAQRSALVNTRVDHHASIAAEVRDMAMTTRSDVESAGESGSTQPVELRSGSADETRLLGEALGALLAPGDLVLLEGDLGAGKTALTQGIGRGLGVAGTINSPTFTLLKEYEGRLPLYHFDLYRIEDPDELLTLGFEDYFTDDGVCVVEWAERGERADEAWPTSWLRIHLDKLSSDERLLRCTASGGRGAVLLAAFARAAEGRAH